MSNTMSKFYLIFWCGMALACIGEAQTYRTDVLVFGDGSSALAAALQSARSGAKTTLLIPHHQLFIDKKSFSNKLSGIALILADSLLHKNIGGRLPVDYQQKIQDYLDTVKNLAIIQDIEPLKAERKGNFWVLDLNSKTKLRADELVDASFDAKLAKLAGAEINPKTEYAQALQKAENHTLNFQNQRVILATVEDQGQVFLLPMGNLLSKNIDHLMIAGRAVTDENVQAKNPASFNIGQSAGALAAYGSFFKSATPHLYAAQVRLVQKELLDYKQSIFDLQDLDLKDKNWRAVQMTLLSGLLKPIAQEGQLYFAPDSILQVSEVIPSLKNMYYKTPIWLEDNHIGNNISLQKAIEMLCYLGNKGYASSYEKIKKTWTKTYGFTTFEDTKNITRLQFAVLVKDYLKSFDLKVDMEGKPRL